MCLSFLMLLVCFRPVPRRVLMAGQDLSRNMVPIHLLKQWTCAQDGRVLPPRDQQALWVRCVVHLCKLELLVDFVRIRWMRVGVHARLSHQEHGCLLFAYPAHCWCCWWWCDWQVAYAEHTKTIQTSQGEANFESGKLGDQDLLLAGYKPPWSEEHFLASEEPI